MADALLAAAHVRESEVETTEYLPRHHAPVSKRAGTRHGMVARGRGRQGPSADHARGGELEALEALLVDDREQLVRLHAPRVARGTMLLCEGCKAACLSIADRYFTGIGGVLYANLSPLDAVTQIEGG